MSNKKNRNKNPNKNIQNFSFANEVKQLKENFKRSIDEMPDEDFIDMISYLMLALKISKMKTGHLMKNGKTKQKNFIIKETLHLTMILTMMIYHFNFKKNFTF